MRGGMFVFPLYVEPEEAAAADALEAVQPVASEPSPVSEAFNPQRLSTIIRSNSNGGLGDASEATADVLHTLPKWAQAVMQTGCFNVRTGQSQFTRKMKRASQQEEDASERPRKRRPMGRREADVTPIEDENSALQECLDELNATKDAEVEDEDVLPTLMTQAQRVAHSMEKYAELLEQLLEKATTCQQHEAFERDEMDVFSPADVKTLSQATKAMDKSDWIRKLDPNLLISVMNVFDTQVQLGLALDVQSALLPNDDDDKMQSPDRMASRLEMALDVAICELIVMATPQIDRKALSEENIDNCIQLLHHVIRRFLLLCIDTTFVTSASAVAKNNAGKRQSIGNKGRVNLRTNKIIRKAVERIIPVVCEFMNQLAALITVVKLADRWVLQLSSSMLELFALEHSSYAASLQQSGLSVLRSIFLQYKAHRELLLEEIVGLMIKLPTNKNTLRKAKLLDSSGSVQRITTLIVSLVQSCASAPTISSPEADSEDPLIDAVDPSLTPDTVSEEKPVQKTGIVDKLLQETQISAKSFVQALLKGCWKKNDERDNRVIVDNFVEDLLVMFVRPEWAGAEAILEVLSKMLANILNATTRNDVKKPNSQQSFSALNLIGKICAAMKRYQREVGHNTLMDDSESTTVVEEHMSLLQNEIFQNKSKRRPLRQMALKHIVVMHLQQPGFEQNDSIKLLLLKFISSVESPPGSGQSSYSSAERKLWLSYWNDSKRTRSSLLKAATPTSDLALKASLQLAVDRDFCGDFDHLFAHLMGLLFKGTPSLRARVMKSLRGIVDVDPTLMADTRVHSAVETCCSDERISVRQAAVDLVGTYVMQQPALFDRYFEILADRLCDKGITVRKSTCRIFKISLTCMQQESRNSSDVEKDLRRKSACMRSLVARVGDTSEDQGVKNFIIDAFQEVWFGAGLSTSRLSSNEFGAGSTLPPGWSILHVTAAIPDENADITEHSYRNGGSLEPTKYISQDGVVVASVEEAWSTYHTPAVTPASVVKNNLSKEDSTPDIVATIVEVIHGIPSLDWFVELLKRLLQDRAVNTRKSGAQFSKDRSAEVEIAKYRSEKIVAGLVNCLMELQEGKLLQGVSMDDGHLQFLSCMKALSAFCEARPLLLSRHLETIRVYLKENHVEIQRLAVSMINSILSVGRVPDRLATVLEKDLRDLVFEAPPSVVGPSIKCLATLSTTRKRPPVLLFHMLERFFLFLQKYKERKSLDKLSSEETSGLQRALFAAGQIAGTTDIDMYKDMPNEAKILDIGSITSSLYEAYAKFVHMSSNAPCVAKAVQGMGSLFPIRPRLFLQAQQDGLLRLLLTHTSAVVKLQCLKSMKELLHYEEQRLEKGLATQTTNRSKSKEQQVQGDQESDAALIGNIMQVELANVLLLSLQNPPQVRMEAIACIGALLTQGLVNPRLCIPYLVALEADRVVANSDAAHAQLLALHEKSTIQFQAPSIDGIRNSYAFQLNVFKNATVFPLDNDKKDYCHFGRLYTACLRSPRAQRVSFLRALIHQLTNSGSAKHPSKGNATFVDDLKYLCYVAHIISALPYDVEDEPLYIIYLINHHVSLHFSPVLDSLKEIFVRTGFPPEVITDEDCNFAHVSIEEYYPLATLTGTQLSKLQNCGRKAFAIALALRLKFHLKTMYGLDNEKCSTYQPSGQSNGTDYSAEMAQRFEKQPLLLPSVDDACQSDDPVRVTWNLFVAAWREDREDQKHMDFEESDSAKAPPKRRRRSRKVTAKHVLEDEGDEEDEYVEGFA